MKPRGHGMRCLAAVALVLIVTAVAAGTASAKVYKWVDADGQVHFTDKRPTRNETETIDVPEVNSYRAPATGGTHGQAEGTAVDEPTVVMYATDWCPYCKKAREYFAANDIAYTEYDVEKSAKGRRDYRKMGEPAVPVIFVDDMRINGFSADRFDRVYQRAVRR